MVNRGQEQTIKDTFIAGEKRRASFSVRKYSDPPVTPSRSMVNSSRKLYEKIRILSAERFRQNGATAIISRYAMINLNVKICAGVSPLWMRTFVEMNVEPHIETVVNAIRWGRSLDFADMNVLIFDTANV